VNADGSFIASEEVRIEGKSFVSHDIKGMFKESTVEAELFGSKLRVQMQLIDTDYDNYLIGYQCYDNIEFAKEKQLDPVHIITVGIAARDRNVADAELAKWEAIAVEKVPDLNASDLAMIQSGDKGKCEYKVAFSTAK
jgi:hypothetical protein